MKFWAGIRDFVSRRRLVRPGAARQADLEPGRLIRPERTVCHAVSVAFPRADVDDATYHLLSERRFWKQLLLEDRARAPRDDEQIGIDDFLLRMLDERALGTIRPPQPCPALPLEFLQYSAVGYNEPLLDLAERCDQMLGFSVYAPNATPIRAGWPLAHHLARLAAQHTGGLVLDHRSERWWSLDRWSTVNPYPGHGALSDWICIHDVVGHGGPAQMHTHGMLHFGLPDLELVDISRFHRGWAGKLMSAACYKLIICALAENGQVAAGDDLVITGDDLRTAQRTSRAQEPTVGATAVRLVPGNPEAALVENRLLRIIPGERYGEGPAGLPACLADLFPTEDDLCTVSDAKLMQRAHEQALVTLPAEHERFRRGLRPGECLAVKVRFPCDDAGGGEYMWIEVHHWHDDAGTGLIEGVLLNKPRHRHDLTLGQTLQVRQPDIYDWLRITPGGRRSGNFTAAAL